MRPIMLVLSFGLLTISIALLTSVFIHDQSNTKTIGNLAWFTLYNFTMFLMILMKNGPKLGSVRKALDRLANIFRLPTPGASK